MNSVCRARLWLGTVVDIRVDGMETTCAVRAIEAAFGEVATVHRLMSFHAEDSDLARLRLAPVGMAVRVNARTHDVLDWSLRIAAASAGAFDPTVAATRVARGVLPVPRSAFVPDVDPSWRDIELLGGERVRLRRPLWIDLGGIAKGFAVDRAVEVLRAHAATNACVNAGGDLRVAGRRAERVYVRDAQGGVLPVLELADGALATSGGSDTVRTSSRSSAQADLTASVVVPRCILADALTKVVLGSGDAAHAALASFGAQAWTHRACDGWRRLDRAA